MKTKIIGTNYMIEEEGTSKGRNLSIGINVDSEGKVSVMNNKGDIEFVFISSKPEMLIKIGKMLTQAGKIALAAKEVEEEPKTSVSLPEIRFYCIRCRKMKYTNRYEDMVMKNGRKAYRAVDDCGAVMFKIA